MLKIENLQKSYGENEVLKGISTEIKKGEVVAIIGPSGSGKSTFLRCMNLMEFPTGGNISFKGQQFTDKVLKDAQINELRENIGMVFQQFNLFPHLTVLDNITLAPIKRNKQTPEEAVKIAEKLLETVGLADKILEYPNNLSGGQQQRVAIARAL